MRTRDFEAFAKHFANQRNRSGSPTMKAALLVNPSGFAISTEAAEDNAYMATGQGLDLERAHHQHQQLARTIQELGVPTVTFAGKKDQPDGIYPNNAYATIPGKAIVGRMYHPSRQRETQRHDIRQFLNTTLGYWETDLSQQKSPCELTGVVAVDRLRQLAFCGLSRRVDTTGSQLIHEAMDMHGTFEFDLDHSEYHTNIVLALLAGRTCVVHPQGLADPDLGRRIASLYGDNHIIIDQEEKNAFVGNCIAVTDADVLMSLTALDGMHATTKDRFHQLGWNLHAVPVDELEKGGGSLRCLIAEIF